MRKHSSRSSLSRNQEFDTLYRNVIKKKAHAMFLKDTVKRHTREPLSQNLIEIQRIARVNTILNSLASDESLVSMAVPMKSILSSIVCEVPYFFSLIGDPQIGQSISQYMKVIYKKPADFSAAVFEYFSDNSADLNLFSAVLFPAICGYFVAEEHLSFAYEVLNYMVQIGRFEFAKPLIVSFYTSSVLFVDTFWDKFMAAANRIRTKPSLYQLYDILVETLSGTIRYMSPLHTALSMDLLTSNREAFAQTFFMQFLLLSFTSFANENPTMKTAKIGKAQIMQLLNFICNNVGTTTFESIESAFFKSASSLYEPTSFVEYTTKGAVPYIFSPLETVLLVRIMDKMPAFKGKTVDFSRIKNQQKLQSFMPGVIEVFFAIPQKADYTAVLFGNEQITIREATQETKRSWMSIKKMCSHSQLDVSKMLAECNVEDSNDTPEIRDIKKDILELSTPELKLYGLEETLGDLINSEQMFETCLVRLSQKSHLVELSDRLLRYNRCLVRFINSKFDSLPPDCSREAFNESVALNQIEIVEDNKLIEILEQKKCFDSVIQKLTLKDQTYKAFVKMHEDILARNSHYFDNMDEKTLGDRLWIITEIVEKLIPICQKDDWILPIFFNILSKSKANSFFQTYLSINQYKSLHPDQFIRLPNAMQSGWKKISSQIDRLLKHKRTFPEEFIDKVNTFMK